MGECVDGRHDIPLFTPGGVLEATYTAPFSVREPISKDATSLRPIRPERLPKPNPPPPARFSVSLAVRIGFIENLRDDQLEPFLSPPRIGGWPTGGNAGVRWQCGQIGDDL